MPSGAHSELGPQPRSLRKLSSTELRALVARELSKPENATWWPFLRSYAIGYAIEVAPSLVKLALVKLIIVFRKAHNGHLSLRIGKAFWGLIIGVLQLIFKGFRPNGFAMACAIAMGGGRWGESAVRPTMEYLVRSFRLLTRSWRRLMSSKARRLGKTAEEEAAKEVCLSAREVNALNVMSTFTSASMASLVAITVLQSQSTPLNKQSQSPLHPITTPYPTISAEPEISALATFTEKLTSSPTPPSFILSDAKPRKPTQSSTLDLTLFFTVRALDTIIQSIYASYSSPYLALLKKCSDILLFQLSCWRIMWCWFYKPQRLPPTYVKWITALAEMDYRLLRLIRVGRAGKYVYGMKPPSEEISKISRAIAADMGLDARLGDPELISKLSCGIVHGKLGASESCLVNSGRRWVQAWRRAMCLYLPVFTVPTILFNRQKWLTSPVHTLLNILLGSSCSAAFLSSFVALTWSGVCIGRSDTLRSLLNKLHRRPITSTTLDFYVAPHLGSFLAGLSIVIENKKRRGEMALYVAMRALYAAIDEVLPAKLLRNIKRHQWVSVLVERLTFALSIGTITSAVVHNPDHVRGVVKGIMSFAVGPHWQERYKSTSTLKN
ncbi:hypothetical protein CROQUDRAFT_655227 [Cronartium quercuum f. sp. fusiforme G11]|uniref:Transmembrane protein 135 N-terminal domain-containing protein n=1 Tax=Cronartium quercuum f. sp. fusiforme G11 TaxID=708437 RepID=A0A9P6TD57_9BASI|nr:hypothetical protein CROQUDRAFT_655227 [Cronartium quercuum f. sp. fusiforme G11]